MFRVDRSCLAMSENKEPPIDPDHAIAGLGRKLKTQTKCQPKRSRRIVLGPRDVVFCGSRKRDYQCWELVRKSWSHPGIRRPGGGPNGARREVWRCCPKGHRLIMVSMRVS